MRCERARAEIKAWQDGELGPVSAWRLRRHLRRCPACAAEAASLRRLDALLRAADLFEPETAAVPESGRPRGRLPVRPAPRIAFAALAVAAAVLVAVVLPSSLPRRSLAAEVGRALERANTWHLSGWKRIGGERVPWEVWGRRRPFLFYEKVGGDITFDDGRERLRIFAPDARLGRPSGLVVRTRAVPDPWGGVSLSYRTMIDQWDWKQPRTPHGQVHGPVRETADEAVFRQPAHTGVSLPGVNVNQMYTVDKRTRLPLRYRLRYNRGTSEWFTESLEARYHLALPAEVTAPPSPAGYSVVDVRVPAAAVPREIGGNRLLSNGLTLRFTPRARDREGNVLIGVRGWLADVPLSTDPWAKKAAAAAFHLHVGYPASGRAVLSPPEYHDDRGRIYVSPWAGSGEVSPAGERLLLLGALEPMAPNAPRPRTLHLTLTVSPTVTVRATDVTDNQGWTSTGWSSEPLFTRELKVPVRLPQSGLPRDLVPVLPVGYANYLGQARWPAPMRLHADLCRARSSYYWGAMDYLKPFYRMAVGDDRPERLQAILERHKEEVEQARRRQRLRAARWMERSAGNVPLRGRLLTERLLRLQPAAIYYRDAGAPDEMRRVLRQILAESAARAAAYGALRREAETALRTGRFAGDIGPDDRASR